MRVYTGAGAEERKTAATGMAPPAPMEMPTTTAASKVEEAGRLPSIEREPKTLTLDQIKYAREAALYVVSTKSEEEAIRIFTAGLKPVETNKHVHGSSSNKSSSMDSSSDDDVDLGYCAHRHHGSNTKNGRRGRRRQHSIDDLRDIATAPF